MKKEEPIITPGLLWNKSGMIQPIVLSALMVFTFFIILYVTRHSQIEHPGLQSWLQRLQALFFSSKVFKDILIAAILGVVFSLLLQVLDALVALLMKENIRSWLHRTDNLLPVNALQKKWALAITIVGSSVEELLFRGFIFFAMVPIWSHWIWAALVLSALFAFLHANIQGFWSSVWIFLISMILCYFVASGRSLYFIATLHIFINLTNLFILPKVFKKQDE
jgi:membrane protease YdiL (CAAX protease family)